MGTSVSQASPKTGGWKVVAACYTDESLPVERLATEIWRAALTQDKSVFEQLGSRAVQECVSQANRSPDIETAMDEARRIHGLKQNTLLGEFAKRALIIKASGGFKSESGTSVLFRQLTDYFVSRDIAGFVGPKYRCKTIAELKHLKDKIGDTVAKKVTLVEKSHQLSNRPWDQVYKVVLNALRTG